MAARLLGQSAHVDPLLASAALNCVSASPAVGVGIGDRTQVRPNRGHSPFVVGTRNDALNLVRGFDPIAITVTVYAVNRGCQ